MSLTKYILVQGEDLWQFVQHVFRGGGFPVGLNTKESACNAEDPGSILRSARSPGEGNGNPLQYYCVGNSMDRGAWWAEVQGLQRVRHND